jgi:hypothetical protein
LEIDPVFPLVGEVLPLVPFEAHLHHPDVSTDLLLRQCAI